MTVLLPHSLDKIRRFMNDIAVSHHSGSPSMPRRGTRLVDVAAVGCTVMVVLLETACSVIGQTDMFVRPITGQVIAHASKLGIICGVVMYIATRLVFLWADASRCSRLGDVDAGTDEAGSGRWRRCVTYALSRCDRMTMRLSMRQRFVPYMALMLVCWIPWIVVCWPGAVRDDTIAQLMQSSGHHEYFTQHPLFDTLIFGVFWNIGEALGHMIYGLAIYTVVQAVLLAAGLSLSLCYMRKCGVPRLCIWAGMIFVSTSYLVVGAVPTMGKDSFHAIFLIPAAVFFVETCLTKGAVLRRMPVTVAFVALLALCIASKRTAMEVVVLALALLLIVAKGNRRVVLMTLVSSVVLVQFVWNPISVAVTHAGPSSNREIMGYVTQPIGRVAAQRPDDITVEERRQLSGFMDVDAAGRQYVPYRTDETVWSYNEQATTADKLNAFKAWASIGVRNPDEYVKAYSAVMFNWANLTFSFTYPTDSDYVFTDEYMKQWATWTQTPEESEQLLHPLMGTSVKATWKHDVAQWIRQVTEHNPLTSIGLYVTYIPLALGWYLLVRRRWAALIAWSFLAWNVLSLYASPMVLFWYAIPVFVILPLFCALPFMDEVSCGRRRVGSVRRYPTLVEPVMMSKGEQGDQ